ncbi:hypothetical protein QQ045_013297 [Rhodiola kirilowii]
MDTRKILRSSGRKIRVIRLLVSAVLLNLICVCAATKEGGTCILSSSCDAGLHCETCIANGNWRPRCTRIQPLNPTANNKGLPFNRYSWLTTHNSFAKLGVKSGTGGPLVAPANQQDSITDQLNNGVRGLMLDMYDFKNDIWLCHSFNGQCFDVTAFQPAINVLREVQAFLEANPTEIVTIFIEDYVNTPNGLTNLFNASGLRKFWFPVSRMPQNGGDWPTVQYMINQNQRLVVFTSKRSKEAAEGIAYDWKYTVENQYGNKGMVDGSCPNRGESAPMDTKSISLVVMNHFPDNPDLVTACKDNSENLINMVNTCHQASGQRWPNYIAVDFYKTSDGGGAPAAVDLANSHLAQGN